MIMVIKFMLIEVITKLLLMSCNKYASVAD